MAAGRSPSPVLAAPQNLRTRPSSFEGSAWLLWQHVPGAMGYILEHTQDPVNGPSSYLAAVTKSTHLATNLTGGTRYWFRVRALGAAGEGPPSGAVAKMAA